MTNVVSHLLGYESGNAKTKWPVLKEDCFAEPEIIKCNPDGHQTDPIAVTFSESLFDQRLLAMADYDGYVSMLNTSEVLPDCINVIDEPDQNVKAQWVAHHNAINDLRFIKGDRQLLTAATDFNLRQWDTMTAACVATLAGHSASVKCLSVHPFCSDVVASGGKDGSIMLWDLRVPACATEQFHVRGAQVHVEVAHRPRSPGSGIFSQAGSDVSITSLQFLKHSGLLASASDTSSTVKLWDVRMIENPVAFLSAELPVGETLPPHLNVAPLSNHLDFKSSSGLCHLSTDPDGLWLTVMRRDGRIHMYDAPRADCSIQPSKEFRVSEPLTLRSTTAVSPDGQWLAATSAYGSTFVFNVNDTRGEPSRLHAGQSGQWQRRYHDASGNMGPIRTAARPDAEATGVCWGKLGSGELAICRTAQQLQVWRSDYVNHDLGMKPPTASKRQEWPTFFEDATESTACNAADNVGIAISECAEQAARAAEHSAVSRLADTCMDRRRSAAHVHAVSGTSSVTVPVTTAGHSDRSSLPAAATAARSEADRPIKGPVHEKAGFSGTAAVAEPGGSASALPVSTAGSTTPQNLHSGASKQSGAALSAALLLPAPAAQNPPQSAERHPAIRHSIAPDATTPTRIPNRAQDAGDCPASEGAATPALCHEDVNEARPSRQESDEEACNGPETDATESAPPSRQNSEEYLPRMSYSAQPSQHGLNNTFVDIALSPQRLSRPARSLGQGLSPSMRAASFQAANSDPAQSGSEVRAGLRTSSGQPSQHAPLATLSSADLIRSPSALMRGGRGAQPPWRPTGVLSPINELPLSVVEGDDIVPETQSIDDSPLRPTVAPIATQFSQARQQDVPKLGSTIPPSAHAVPAATLSQQIALAHNTCEDSLLAAGQHASCSAQRQRPSEEPVVVPHQHQGKAQASAGRNATTERKAAPQLCSSREIGQEPELKQRHARKRASVEMTADVLVRDMGQSGASGCEKRSGTKHSRQPSLAPDEANGASHPKFQPPICDSQPREVFAIVKCKRRRITATSVHTNARSKSAFKAAGCSEPAKATQEDSMSMKSQGCSGENSAGMLNITSQQDCTQDSSSLVASRKMVVGESLKQLGLRRRGKAPAKSQPAGSQPNIMSFFRRD